MRIRQLKKCSWIPNSGYEVWEYIHGSSSVYVVYDTRTGKTFPEMYRTLEDAEQDAIDCFMGKKKIEEVAVVE